MKTLGQRIKLLRGAESQEAFAKRIGVSKGSLGGYERDENSPSADAILKICTSDNISVEWLMTGQGSMRRGGGDSQEQKVNQALSADEPPRAQGDESLKIANERLYQALEGQLAMQKEIGELKAENAMLRERVVAREQALRDIRDIYELQEADVGSVSTSALIALLRDPTTR